MAAVDREDEESHWRYGQDSRLALSSERPSESTWENVKSMRKGIFVDTYDGKLVRICVGSVVGGFVGAFD